MNCLIFFPPNSQTTMATIQENKKPKHTLKTLKALGHNWVLIVFFCWVLLILSDFILETLELWIGFGDKCDNGICEVGKGRKFQFAIYHHRFLHTVWYQICTIKRIKLEVQSSNKNS
ncbi:hypothetical protein GIB67_022707 [Kingdonia uniflora]|uniref:Uncharacterized protein n=1 Tax=Kingdonia uniflora TaxID=39325 RepID=A0A7J7P8D4_9MAGN|nr:hypothetical protein GIB67_022707 [Kingdonia uniflora]